MKTIKSKLNMRRQKNNYLKILLILGVQKFKKIQKVAEVKKIYPKSSNSMEKSLKLAQKCPKFSKNVQKHSIISQQYTVDSR